jgi:hypothetical protein
MTSLCGAIFLHVKMQARLVVANDVASEVDIAPGIKMTPSLLFVTVFGMPASTGDVDTGERLSDMKIVCG